MSGIVLPYENKHPKIGEDVFIAPNACVVGDVHIGDCSSVWFGASVRGDFQPVRIGKYTNIQDNATVHVMGDTPTEIGDHVTIGHNALVHCRRIGDNCLIGMGSIILGYCEIGQNCIIGAGTLVTQRKKIPSNCIVFGNPAKIIRPVRDDEIDALYASSMEYYAFAKNYRKESELWSNDIKDRIMNLRSER